MYLKPQSKDTFKIVFTIRFQYIEDLEEIFQNLFLSDLLSFVSSEVESQTIEAASTDIWLIEVYINHFPSQAILEKIKKQAKEKNIIIENSLTIEEVKDKDWVSFYHQNLQPIEIGSFFISSLIHKDLCPINKKGIFIDSAQAFGTGDHPTTAGCIEALEELGSYKFNDILDLGCGTGILSFAAEKIWPFASIYACDIDEIAVNISINNAKINNSKVNFYQNSPEKILSDNILNKEFDLIISNILAGPLINMAGNLSNLIKLEGYIILSGFLNNQLESLIKAYQDNSFEIIKVMHKNSWVILICKVKTY